MKVLENIKDRYLTWRTGYSRDERAYNSWYDANVNRRANTIRGIFVNFKYVIEVDGWKFLDFSDPFGWYPVSDAKQYFWPQREIGENCVYIMERVLWDQWSNEWHLNSLGGEDKIFVATNSERDAIMIALKWS